MSEEQYYIIVRDGEDSNRPVVLMFSRPDIRTDMAGDVAVSMAMVAAALPLVSQWGMRHYEVTCVDTIDDYVLWSEDVVLDCGEVVTV